MGVLDGKVAIVTGGAQGIGRAEAVALAKEGAAVTVIDYRGVDETVQTIEALGLPDGRVMGMRCDVRKSDEVARVVSETVSRFGPVDILVNNAHKLTMPHGVEEWTEQEMMEQWESGPFGTWLFMKQCFPHMKGRGGRIINTASSAGYGAYSGYTGYAATKEAIRSLTRTAAREWGKHGITVNAIAPAARTSGAEGAMDEAAEAKLNELFALGRWGDPEKDIARTVVFLAGPDAAYLTGNTVSVDGGLAMLV